MYKWIIGFIAITQVLAAQESNIHLSNNGFAHNWQSDFDHGLVAVALRELENNDLDDTEFSHAIYSSILKENRSSQLLSESLMSLNSSYADALAKLHLGLLYFSQEAYEKSLEALETVNPKNINPATLEEYYFKVGYLSLINKKFKQSIANLNHAINAGKELHTEAIYYRGVANFFEGNLDSTTSDFEKISNEPQYKNLIPYYLTQIYFSNREFDKVIEYAPQQLKKESVENKNEIEKLLGQAYYNKGDFNNALIHLEAYEKSTKKLTKEEFYLLGNTYYQRQEYKKAIPFFLEINKVDGALGTIVNTHLADCYLKTYQRDYALACYKMIMNNSKDKALVELTSLNYAKLSYELENDRIAIKTLEKFNPESKYFDESQKLLSDILIRSDDYEVALNTIENLPVKSPELLSSYQSLSFNLATQSMLDNDNKKALRYFEVTKETPGSETLKAESIYWTAQIYATENKKQRSESALDNYFNIPNIEYQKSYFDANYLRGYHAFNEKKIQTAIRYFQEGESSYNPEYNNEKKYNDLVLRLADCHFYENEFSDAKQYYSKAEKSNNKPDYAAFQRTNVLYANGDFYDAIIELEDFILSYPDSEYVDDAIFSLGQQLQKVQKPIEALRAYQNIINNYPNSSYQAGALVKAGLISYNQGDLKNAIIYYKRVFSSGAQGTEKKEALEALQEIYLENLNDPETYFDFAKNEANLEISAFTQDSLSYALFDAKFKEGEYREAIISADKYIDRYTKGYYLNEALFIRGESYSILKEYSLALESYIALAKDKSNKYYEDGIKKAALIYYNHEEDFPRSINYLEDVIKLELNKEEKINFLTSLVISYFKTGNMQEIPRVADQLLSEENLSKEIIARTNYYKGKAYLMLQNPHDANRAFEQVELNSNNNQAAEAMYNIAVIFYENGMLDTAENKLLETTKKAANYPKWVAKSLLLLGKIYLEKGDLLNARAATEALIENFTEDEQITASAKAQLELIDKEESASNRVKTPKQEDQIELDTTSQKKN